MTKTRQFQCDLYTLNLACPADYVEALLAAPVFKATFVYIADAARSVPTIWKFGASYKSNSSFMISYPGSIRGPCDAEFSQNLSTPLYCSDF